MSVPERAVIALLEAALGEGGRRVTVGIGDDAAVLRATASKLVWTVDACVENVHFDRRWLSLEDVGWRAMHAAVSDIAAMGGRPIGALSSLILPKKIDRRQLRALGRGQATAAARMHCPVVGGNVSAGDALSVTTTVVGRATHPLLRSGAKAGQELWLVGDVGLAAAGLRLLRSAPPTRRALHDRSVCVEAWRRPVARLREGSRLASRATSAIDVSDGLSGDCAHLSRASRVRIVIEQRALEAALRAELAPVAELLGTTPLELALSGGEDYALVATGPAIRRPRWARRIGRVESGRGVFVEDETGRRPLSGGYEHG